MKKNRILFSKRSQSFFWILLFSISTVFAQVAITGVVTDETKEPMPGVSVIVKGTKTGTVTDANGRYRISMPKGSSVLTFSFLGYAVKEVTVGNKKQINVEMKEDAKMLDEVVAIGYGSVKKSDLTGAVSKADMGDLTKAAVASIDQALAGRIAGVQVVATDGRPGATSNIVIRGSNTISDSSDGSPLYVIDGFPMEDPNLAAYNPNDIESIDVLKDASATAIYGARGANGVIIIQTKRGKEAPPTVTYDGYFSWQTEPQFLKMMGAYDFVKLQTELNQYSEQYLDRTYLSYDERLGRHQTLEDYRNRKAYNWQDIVLDGAPFTSHHVSLNGGTQRTKYSASASYFHQKGTLTSSEYNSFRTRLTLDQQVTSNVTVGFTVNYANNRTHGANPSESHGGWTSSHYLFYSILGYRPLAYKLDEDILNQPFDPNINSATDYRYNPVKTVQNEDSGNLSRQLNMNAYLTWKITKKLEFKVTGALSSNIVRSTSFNNSETYWGDARYQPDKQNGSFNYTEYNNWSNDYTLTYRTKVKNHNILGMLGASISSNQYQRLGGQASLVPWEELGLWGIDQGTPKKIYAEKTEQHMMSFFARANYDWKSRYLLTGTIRADGSSRLIYNKWGYFPSASGAWRVSEEKFMKPVRKWMSNLKLRAGWGITGNNRTQENYPSHLLYAGNENYAFNNTMYPAIYIRQMANKDLKWESTYQTNIGLDLGFFGNRINAVIDYYNKHTKDLLLYADTPPSIGFEQVQQNIGSVRNSGFEFAINTVNLKGGNNKLKWTSSFNISFNKNEITALSDGQTSRVVGIRYPEIPDMYIAKVGHPLSEMYGYVFDGVYQYEDFNEVSPNNFVLKDGIPDNGRKRSEIRPGDPKLKDINGDGKITTDDRTIIGHGLPIHIGGFTNRFEYRGFDLSIFLQWSYGNDLINYNRKLLEELKSAHTNQLATAVNHWTPRTVNADGSITPGNYTNYLWAPTRGFYEPGFNTDREVEDASVLRLKTIQLGYNFPAKWLKKGKIKSLRLYVTGQDLITWTNYSGYDPEVSTRNSSMTRGFDYSAYPRSATYTFGVKMSL